MLRTWTRYRLNVMQNKTSPVGLLRRRSCRIRNIWMSFFAIPPIPHRSLYGGNVEFTSRMKYAQRYNNILSKHRTCARINMFECNGWTSSCTPTWYISHVYYI